jgi:hypothetical protein
VPIYHCEAEPRAMVPWPRMATTIRQPRTANDAAGEVAPREVSGDLSALA